MTFAFVCANQDDDDDWIDDEHDTTTVMTLCPRCDRPAVAGYICDTCGHEDVEPDDRLTGHGAGRCEPAA